MCVLNAYTDWNETKWLRNWHLYAQLFIEATWLLIMYVGDIDKQIVKNKPIAWNNWTFDLARLKISWAENEFILDVGLPSESHRI